MTIEGPLYYYWVSHPNLQYIVSPVLRNSKLYTKAVEDLNNLTFFRLRNAFYKYNIIYNMSSDGRLSHHACQIAHEHTGSVFFPPAFLPLSGSSQRHDHISQT